MHICVVAPPGECLRVKADIVLFAGNTVSSIPERFKGYIVVPKSCKNPRLLYFAYFTTGVKNRARSTKIKWLVMTHRVCQHHAAGWTYQAPVMLSGRSRKHRLRSRPAHSWTPMMPKMKKTKKQRRRTLPSIGNVSSNNITSIRIPGQY